VTQSIHIHLNKSEGDTQAETPIRADAYAELAAGPAWSLNAGESGLEKTEFVIATDHAGAILRVVSQNNAERHIVGALVGSWVARGYRVQYIDGIAALIKALRKSMKATESPTANGSDEGAAQKTAVAQELQAPSGEPVALGAEKTDGLFV
jgi:hypothetical protein